MFFSVVSALVVYFRWDIKYSIAKYKANRKPRPQDQQNVIEIPLNEHYDAFVSYTPADLHWVTHELIPNLEESTSEDIHFRLCISDRDFLPGRFIVDNIHESIERSKKAMFLVTEAFLNSEWNEFELNMSQVKLFDDRKDMIILVFLEKLRRDDIPRTLRTLMGHVPHLQWPEKERKRRVLVYIFCTHSCPDNCLTYISTKE